MSASAPQGRHPPESTLAAYLEGRLEAEARARLIEHLADCGECREELLDAGRALRASRARPLVWMGGLAAAAAVVLMLARVPLGISPGPAVDTLRENGLVAAAPVPIAPAGTVTTVRTLAWSGVPLASRYRTTLFDAGGRVLWEAESTDTTVALPESIAVTPGASYAWTVSARIGFDRWTTSPLTTFTVGPSR